MLGSDDRPIGVASRGVVHAFGLPHRSVHILVWHPQPPRRLLLQRRSETKKDWPGLWDTSVGGHVGAGETPLEAAPRECREELGVGIAPAALLQGPEHHMHEEPLDRETVANFHLVHPGPFHPDPIEVAEVAWFEREAVEALVSRGGTTPHFALQWRQDLSRRFGPPEA